MQADAQRLLHIHVLAGARGGQGDQDVPVVVGGDRDAIDIGAREQLAEIRIHRRARRAVGFVDHLGALFLQPALRVADGDHLAIRHGEEGAEVVPAHHAQADLGHRDLIARGNESIAAKGFGGDKERRHAGGRRGGDTALQKLTATELMLGFHGLVATPHGGDSCVRRKHRAAGDHQTMTSLNHNSNTPQREVRGRGRSPREVTTMAWCRAYQTRLGVEMIGVKHKAEENAWKWALSQGDWVDAVATIVHESAGFKWAFHAKCIMRIATLVATDQANLDRHGMDLQAHRSISPLSYPYPIPILPLIRQIYSPADRACEAMHRARTHFRVESYPSNGTTAAKATPIKNYAAL
jgi:hypothetical protein